MKQKEKVKRSPEKEKTKKAKTWQGRGKVEKKEEVQDTKREE